MVQAAWHLDRLRELADNFEDYTGLHGPGVQAEYLLAAGRPRDALGLLERTVEQHAFAEPKYGDTLLLWAARAAAALPASERGPALDAVCAARDRCPVPAFDGEDRDPGQRAVHALFDAESARCRGDSDVVERWQAAIPLADAAGLRYVAADARLRLAEAMLALRHRREAGMLLREAHAMAAEMGALRLRDEVATVAGAARVTLTEPKVAAQSNGHGLTHREQEVLAHLVAGRSYGEIADALFISEKTVSVHVSNVLRKTGTGSRVEAAAWARRSGAAG
jgi:DNA-binding CsgD family transcriptional regulator